MRSKAARSLTSKGASFSSQSPAQHPLVDVEQFLVAVGRGSHPEGLDQRLGGHGIEPEGERSSPEKFASDGGELKVEVAFPVRPR